MKSLSKFIAFILVLGGVNAVSAQTSLKDDEARKATEVKALVNSERYTFEATKIVTPKGDSRSLATGRDLDISKDTLIAYLPDLGAAPTTPVNAKAPGITCTHFNYNVTKGNNGHWEVTIKPMEKPGDMKNVRKINMDISSLGHTTLTVTEAGHGKIVYYGYIKPHSAEFPRVSAQR